MKFAIIDNQRVEARPGLVGRCIGCEQPTVAKCGDVRTWHWAHKSKRQCDSWWENETEWHRAWKNRFPVQWQEIRHSASDGEWHVADVKTPDGWVFEFQHSHLEAVERHSREEFYRSLIWIVDGRRRPRDLPGLEKSIARGNPLIPPSASDLRLEKPGGALLRDWRGSAAHVFFDFGPGNRLVWLFPGSDERRAYVSIVHREYVIRLLTERGWRELESAISRVSALISRLEPCPLTRSPQRPAPPPLPPGYLPPNRRGPRL